MNEATLELAQAGLRRGPDRAPCRDDLAFEALQSEFQKLERPDGQVPDWSGAAKGATDLLANKSKDILVAAYLAIALFEKDGYDAFADGMQVIRDLWARGGETLYPERPRGRQAALQFLGDRGAKRVLVRGTSGATREKRRTRDGGGWTNSTRSRPRSSRARAAVLRTAPRVLHGARADGARGARNAARRPSRRPRPPPLLRRPRPRSRRRRVRRCRRASRTPTTGTPRRTRSSP